MATTFCTNHIRQIGICLSVLFSRDEQQRPKLRRAGVHVVMVLCFVAGVTVATVACRFLHVRAIWLALIPLAILAVDLLHADLTKEKNLLEQTPAGH